MERPGNGAGDGVRTRDPELGKLVLYQLSYTRMPVRLVVTPMKARSFAPVPCFKRQHHVSEETARLMPNLLPYNSNTSI